MMRAFLSFLLITVLISSTLYAQSDTAAYRAATALTAPTEKIHALEDFVRAYPASAMRGGAYDALFTLYVDQGNEALALPAATHYIETVPPEGRAGPYNEVAYALAIKNIGLDSALAYATRAEELARPQGGGMFSAIEDTRAYVLYRLGRTAEAEKLQLEAIKGHEDDPEYIAHLAVFEEANGKRREALEALCRALFLGADQDLKSTFAGWLRSEEKDSTARDALKQSIVMATVRASIDTTAGERAIGTKSKDAAFMAGMGVHLQTARQWADEAVASLAKSSPAEDIVAFRKNLALVYAAQSEYPDALTSLRSIQDLVSPWDTEFWATLGTIYERLGDPGKAIEAYMQGLTVMNPKDLRASLERVYAKVRGSTDGLSADLDRLKQAGATFDPGHSARADDAGGRIVLAELFTGAECGPCVGSDLAFDALREHFRNSSLAILEYHVHIPGPDPLTTDDSWNRFQSYGGSGTPTVVIDGKEKIVGGGPKGLTRNRFNLYRYSIDRRESMDAGARLSLKVVTSDEKVTVRAEVGDFSNSVEKPVLHLALVERAVRYTGGNGISRHAFVVRSMFYGPGGTALAVNQKAIVVNAEISLTDVEHQLQQFLDNPKDHVSWPKWMKSFTGWKSRPEGFDRSNLAVIAWVQDAKTDEVLQAAVEDVRSSMSAK